jgi:ketosteroid isomerase-like protein
MLQRLVCLLLVATIFSTSVFAQSKDEQAVAAAVESLRKAMIDPDKNTLDKLTCTELSYGHSAGKIEDKAAFMNALLSGSSDFVTIDLTEQTIKIAGNNAIVRHILKGTNNDGGKPGAPHLYVLLVWQKQNGSWKLLARQAAKVPAP